MRTFGIWFFGLLATAIVGGVVGNAIAPYDFGGFWGIVGGISIFACLRLSRVRPPARK